MGGVDNRRAAAEHHHWLLVRSRSGISCPLVSEWVTGGGVGVVIIVLDVEEYINQAPC